MISPIKEFVEYLKDNPEGYWFKRKLFGWGWTPATREGWVVTLVIIGLIVGNAVRVGDRQLTDMEAVVELITPTFVLILILIVVCLIKGEKPKWQWGFPKKDDNAQ